MPMKSLSKVPAPKQNIKKEEIKTSDTETFVRKNFPCIGNESQVRYCPIGDNCFRINFYTKKDPNNFCSDFSINRSLFVVLKRVLHGFEYSILKD
jgi:hypothetical protein